MMTSVEPPQTPKHELAVPVMSRPPDVNIGTMHAIDAVRGEEGRWRIAEHSNGIDAQPCHIIEKCRHGVARRRCQIEAEIANDDAAVAARPVGAGK